MIEVLYDRDSHMLKVIEDGDKLRVLIADVQKIERVDEDLHAVYQGRSLVSKVHVWADKITIMEVEK